MKSFTLITIALLSVSVDNVVGVYPCPGPQVTRVLPQPDETVPGVPVTPYGLTVNNQYLVDIPAYVLNTPMIKYHKVPAGAIPAGTQYRLECPACVVGGCHFYLFTYHCPPCTDNINGGWGALLEGGSSWEVRSCAPKFLEGGYSHPMIIYRHTVAAGSHVDTIVTTKPAGYFGFFSAPSNDALPWCGPGVGPNRPGYNTCRDHCCGLPHSAPQP